MASNIHQGLAIALLGAGVAFIACGPSASDDPNPSATTPTPTVPPPPAGTTSTTGTATPTPPTTPPGTPDVCDGPGEDYVPLELNGGTCTTTAPPNCIVNEFAATFACEDGGNTPG